MRSAAVMACFLVVAAWQPPALAGNLLQLYRQAVAGSPALKLQELRVEQAGARRDQVRSRLFLQLSASATQARNDFQTEGRPGDLYSSRRQTIQARQPLVDLAALHSGRAEEARVRQSEDEAVAARMEIAGELVDRYLDVLGALDQLAYLEAEKSSTLGQLRRLRRLRDLQMAKVTDLYEVEAHQAALEAREIEAQNVRDVALERLRELTGTAVREVSPLVREDIPAPPGSLQEWVDRGIGNNRELLALQHAVAAEDSGVAGARAQHLPQLALVASKTWADTGFDNRRNPPYDVETVGLQLTVPLLEGGRVNALVRESVARRDMARQQYELRRREMERQIRAAYLKTVSDRARIDAAAQAVLAQEKAVEAQTRGVELGTSTVVDLLDARRRLYRARTERSRARLDLVSSLAALRVQSGALGDADMEEIDSWLAGGQDR